MALVRKPVNSGLGETMLDTMFTPSAWILLSPVTFLNKEGIAL